MQHAELARETSPERQGKGSEEAANRSRPREAWHRNRRKAILTLKDTGSKKSVLPPKNLSTSVLAYLHTCILNVTKVNYDDKRSRKKGEMVLSMPMPCTS